MVKITQSKIEVSQLKSDNVIDSNVLNSSSLTSQTIQSNSAKIQNELILPISEPLQDNTIFIKNQVLTYRVDGKDIPVNNTSPIVSGATIYNHVLGGKVRTNGMRYELELPALTLESINGNKNITLGSTTLNLRVFDIDSSMNLSLQSPLQKYVGMDSFDFTEGQYQSFLDLDLYDNSTFTIEISQPSGGDAQELTVTITNTGSGTIDDLLTDLKNNIKTGNYYKFHSTTSNFLIGIASSQPTINNSKIEFKIISDVWCQDAYITYQAEFSNLIFNKISLGSQFHFSQQSVNPFGANYPNRFVVIEKYKLVVFQSQLNNHKFAQVFYPFFEIASNKGTASAQNSQFNYNKIPKKLIDKMTTELIGSDPKDGLLTGLLNIPFWGGRNYASLAPAQADFPVSKEFNGSSRKYYQFLEECVVTDKIYFKGMTFNIDNTLTKWYSPIFSEIGLISYNSVTEVISLEENTRSISQEDLVLSSINYAFTPSISSIFKAGERNVNIYELTTDEISGFNQYGVGLRAVDYIDRIPFNQTVASDCCYLDRDTYDNNSDVYVWSLGFTNTVLSLITQKKQSGNDNSYIPAVDVALSVVGTTVDQVSDIVTNVKLN